MSLRKEIRSSAGSETSPEIFMRRPKLSDEDERPLLTDEDNTMSKDSSDPFYTVKEYVVMFS